MSSRSLALACATLTCAALVLAAAGSSRAAGASDERGPLRLRYRNGSSEQIATRVLEDAEYISINDVSRLFSAVKHWDADTFEMELDLEGGSARLTLGNPVVIVNDEAILIPGAVQMFDGVLWVPLELVTQHLPRLGSKRFAWIEPLRELRVAGARANVDRVRVERNATGARVRIAITEPLSASAALEGRLLTVSWSEAILPENALALDDPSQMVDSMSVVAREQGAEIRLLLAGKFGDLFVDAGEAPPATVVRLVASANANSGADAAQESGASDSERWMSDEAGTEALEPGVPTIVIDPGHGGLDEGVVGRSGLREKDVALEIAQALRSRLEERMSARVILTREDDESVRPERRTTIANTSDGDLMVSLHCNAASDLEAGGFEAYIYRSEEKPPPRRPVAPVAQESFERDEAAEPDAGGSPTRDAELQLEQWGFVQVPYIERSRRLAEILCKSVDRVGGLSNRGVRSGSVLELAGARMPAVHAEIGFLTNPDDEARLASSEFRAKLADALARGIEAFVRSGDADEASMPHDPEEQAARGDATPPPIAPTAAGTR